MAEPMDGMRDRDPSADPARDPNRHPSEGATGDVAAVLGRRARRRRRPGQSGYSLIELLAVIAVLLIIAALAVPQVLGMRDKAKGKECDRLFHTLDSEIHNALDDLIFTSTEVIDIVLRAHGDEDRNPRNKQQPVFVQTLNSAGANYVSQSAIESCQVVFTGQDVLSVNTVQARDAADMGGGERTFTIGLQ